jgi:hypothetical protein
MYVWTVIWGHSCDRPATAREASRWSAEVQGEWVAHTAEEAEL